LAQLIGSTNSRYEAVRALEQMGSNAEKAVLPLLQSSERSTRSEAARILGKVGGEESLKTLKTFLANNPKDFANFRVKSALNEIEKRLAAESN
jgi:HEAT repeat protein